LLLLPNLGRTDARGQNYLLREARRRGLSTARLKSTLIGTIANDQLVNAMLDDAEVVALDPPQKERNL
jgi:hypothetical protein